jgi:hypothetical protein
MIRRCFGDGLGVVGGCLKLVWGWFGGVAGMQWDGEIRVTIRAGLLPGSLLGSPWDLLWFPRWVLADPHTATGDSPTPREYPQDTPR